MKALPQPNTNHRTRIFFPYLRGVKLTLCPGLDLPGSFQARAIPGHRVFPAKSMLQQQPLTLMWGKKQQQLQQGAGLAAKEVGPWWCKWTKRPDGNGGYIDPHSPLCCPFPCPLTINMLKGSRFCSRALIPWQAPPNF